MTSVTGSIAAATTVQNTSNISTATPSIGNTMTTANAVPSLAHVHNSAVARPSPISTAHAPASFAIDSSSTSSGEQFNYAKMLMNYFYRLSQMNEQSWLSIGRLALSLSETDKAKLAFEQAYKNNPNSMPAIQNLAQINKQRENYLNAIDLYQKILNVDSQNSDAWSALAFCFLMQDDIQKAFSAYQQALFFAPNSKDPYLWYGLGILYERHGSDDQAEEFFVSAIKCDHTFEKTAEIVYRLAVIFKNKKNFVRSLECFDSIVHRPPKPLTESDICFQIGALHVAEGDLEAAQQKFDEIMAQNPRHVKTLQQLSWSQFCAGDVDGALERISACIDVDSSDSASWYILGRCHVALRNSNKAYEAYQQAVLRNGKNPVYWCSIGLLYFHIQQYRDALDAFSKAIHINPNLWEVWWNLGILYETCNNQTSDAIDSYKRALDVDTSNMLVSQRLKLLKGYQQTAASGASPPSPVPTPVDLAFAVAVPPPWQLFSKRSSVRQQSTSVAAASTSSASPSIPQPPFGPGSSSFGHSSQLVSRPSSGSFNVRQSSGSVAPAASHSYSNYQGANSMGRTAALSMSQQQHQQQQHTAMSHDQMMRKPHSASAVYSAAQRSHHGGPNSLSAAAAAGAHRFSAQNQNTFSETTHYLNNIRGNLYQNELRSAAMQQQQQHQHKKASSFYSQSHNSRPLLTPSVSGSLNSINASPYPSNANVSSFNANGVEDATMKGSSLQSQRSMSLVDGAMNGASVHMQPTQLSRSATIAVNDAPYAEASA